MGRNDSPGSRGALPRHNRADPTRKKPPISSHGVVTFSKATGALDKATIRLDYQVLPPINDG